MTSESPSGDAARLDKWLWVARFYKTRALAAEAIDAGRVLVNDERVKRARRVRLGDRLGGRSDRGRQHARGRSGLRVSG